MSCGSCCWNATWQAEFPFTVSEIFETCWSRQIREVPYSRISRYIMSVVVSFVKFVGFFRNMLWASSTMIAWSNAWDEWSWRAFFSL